MATINHPCQNQLPEVLGGIMAYSDQGLGYCRFVVPSPVIIHWPEYMATIKISSRFLGSGRGIRAALLLDLLEH